MTPAPVPERTTPRLVLRAFRDDDRAAFATMNADPVVMEHYPATMTPDESDAFVDRVATTWVRHGYGLWALQSRDSGDFIGYAGLWPVPHTIPIRDRPDPCVEVGWRLAASRWGQGLATEAGREAARYARTVLALTELVSFTAVGNGRSRAVMSRVGLSHDPGDDFDHPSLPQGHPLRRHVLYRQRWPASS